MCIGRVINHDWWPIRIKFKIFWGLHSWIEYVAYPFLWTYAENKESIFGVAFGRLLSCLPTELISIWVIPPGSAFYFAKSVVVTLSELILTLIILDSICNYKTPNIWIIDEAKKRRVQNPFWLLLNFVKYIFMDRNVLVICAMRSWVNFSNIDTILLSFYRT